LGEIVGSRMGAGDPGASAYTANSGDALATHPNPESQPPNAKPKCHPNTGVQSIKIESHFFSR